MAEMHQLDILCRVCGGRLQRAKKRAPIHKCTNNLEGLQGTFGISVGSDDPDIHPGSFCNQCFAALKRQTTAGCAVPSFSRCIFLDETHCGRLHSMFEVSLVV